MRKLYVLLLLMIFCVAKGNAQDLKFLWAKQVKTRNFGSGTSIITDLDKNVYTLGDFAKYGDFDPDEGGVVINENSEYGNIYLQKRNSAGKHLWVKQIKGTVVETHRVITDSEGNLYILGYFGGKIDIDLGEGENWLTSKNDRNYDLFILKLDSEGNTIWIKQMSYGGFGKGDIKIGKDNNLYMTYSFSRELSIIKNGKEEFFKTERDAALVLKMSLEGEYDWVKIFDGKGGVVNAESISTDQNSNVYVSGTFSDLIHFDKNSEEGELGANGAIVTYITKLDTGGNFKWAKKIDGNNVRVKGFAMANDQENNLYIAGGFSGKVDMDPNEGVHEVTSLGVITNGYVLKWSPKGEFIWAKRTRTRGRYGSIMDFALDSGGNSYAVGTADGDIVAEYENRTEIIKGKKAKKQIYIQKIDANGKLKWLKGMNVGRGKAEEIHLENDSDLYVTGSFSETVDFDMSEGEKLLTSNDRTDPFTLKMSVGEDEVVVEEEIVEDNYDYVNEVDPQDLELTWAKQIKGADSNSGNYVTTDLNDNTYIVGKFANFTDFNPTEKGGILKTDGERDVYIQKRNSNGKHVWAKQIKGTSARNVGRVITDYENNIYIIGIFKGKADFDLGEGEKWLAAKGNSDIFILKLDPEGNTIWVEQISTGGSFLHQSADTGSIAIGTDNNLYVTGFFRDSLSATIGGQSINFSSERESVFILKMGLDGGLKWANQFEGKGATYANSLSLDQDNSIYISGHFTASVDFDPSAGEYLLKTEGKRERAMFIAKLDTEGNFKWAKKIKGAMVNSGGSLANDARNNLYVSGRFSGTIDINPNEGVYHLTALPRYGSNSFILKLTSAGAFLWATPTRSDKFCMLNEIVVDKEGYSYGLGFFSGTIKYGKEDNEKLISSKGSNQILIQKISPIGTLEWVKGIGGEGADFGMGLHIDNDYNLYATGSFEEKVNFNVNTIEKNLTSGTRGDTFVLKMSIVGDGWFCEEDQEEEVYNLEYVWGKQLKGDSNNEGESITTDCDGNVYVTGSFKGITDFDTYLDGKRLTNGYKEASDIYIQKLTPEGYHVWAKQIMGSSTQQ
ncbi:NHL repeat-containing protein, partial [Tenacibaculum maritimum]|uniref:hypothetical protein n=1 Tax=Tenacibaculum maritimum TaxID=107401 RepID=UPI00191613F5